VGTASGPGRPGFKFQQPVPGDISFASAKRAVQQSSLQLHNKRPESARITRCVLTINKVTWTYEQVTSLDQNTKWFA
jgi:hypothetical protein